MGGEVGRPVHGRATATKVAAARCATERELARESYMFRLRFAVARAVARLLVGLLCSACGSAATDAPAPSTACPSRFATSVESFSPGPGSDFGQADLPEIVLGSPKGRGDANGSFDVASLGNGGSITLGFAPS